MSDQEYFTVHHHMTANVEPLDDGVTLPSCNDFDAEIPVPFKVASEFCHLEQANEHARLDMQNKDIRQIVELLENQNAKLNLLLTYMLSQQDDPRYRYTTESFGASQFTFRSTQAMPTDMQARVKLFLEHPSAAIYCYGRVTGCDAQENDFLITMKYERLRDSDQDLLIKAALFQQQKLLRQRSLTREKQ
ncbi:MULTISPECIES: PilZ domain-containing protein [unclassified Vibrio]|uniref:PilZ domain-containing protein n=1 Tax=unclassified Vibrio TaxID=2614977 RepID=UPI001361116D|nr:MULTISPECIES: PilZ domain-containing protein [unclassified Vibrio]NAW59814.1 PilZ domain-containing protein [Vibrio sp. V36_P2S2PM302]NAX22075.1 PilZ domain-containing protein [Vibrio sp. V39_P1S14PM300]NAX24726.1 PilZ domain-containing protein [Vibrio sp. V38_P2S17PM301]NAX28836.1 PilZ domain-containing protein [Vibrio sp. V37_P2S8PM304]